MPKKKKSPTSPLPDDWRQRTEERVKIQKIRRCDKNAMLRLLRKDDVQKAAALLWLKIPQAYGIDLLTGIVTTALYYLAVPIENHPALNLTSAAWRKRAESDAPGDSKSNSLLLAEYAPKFRPKEQASRAALNRLRTYFQAAVGTPLNNIVAHFMRARFGASWTEEIVRIRASQWKRDFPEWEREREPSLVDAATAVILKNRK